MREDLLVRPMKTTDAGGVYRTSSEALPETADEREEVRWITGAQNWSIPVLLEAGLSLFPAGPICVKGDLGPLTPYLPSGPFL